MPEVMACVQHLYREAGEDLAAGLILTPYVDFCVADATRPQEAIKLIETSGDKFVDLLTPSLIAGSRIDTEYYLKEAIRLSIHQDATIKERAIFSLGRLEYPFKEGDLPEKALTKLEHAIEKENEDVLIAVIIASAFGLYEKQKSLDDRVTMLIDTALIKGGDSALYAASRMLRFKNYEIPELLLDKLLHHLRRVNPAHRRTLNNIDYRLQELLAGENPEKAIRFIEELLTANTGTLSIETFDNVSWELLRNKDGLLNRIMTKWFLGGERALCKVILDILIHQDISHDLPLAADPKELYGIDSNRIFFLAKKAIGYLFFRPVTAASIILSLIQYTEEKETKKALTELLFDPLLINYPGKVENYLKEQINSEIDAIKIACEEAIATFEQYKHELQSTGDIPELYPYQSHREDYHRHHFRQMLEVTKRAEEKSILGGLVSKAVILYGRSSIVYVYKSKGKTERVETPFHHHEFSFEIPRLSVITPFEFEYMLHVFQAEKIQA
uniref:Uncharacterized protein n=1 Tax=Candidatus Kentrum sp. TUN TaxID=2126343 RepID=A0A450ZZ00_9GAMM|nr:MAG: hypothetical protein BECKTUN1418D_GA0071000_109310 [Candidatus Kentron sp. TUN]